MTRGANALERERQVVERRRWIAGGTLDRRFVGHPLTQNGDRPTLSWKGSTNATYKMLWDKNTLDVSNIRTWSPTSAPPSPALTDTTPFILEIRH